MSIDQTTTRIPVVLAGTQCLSGVTTWAERLRKELAAHPRFDMRLLHVELEPGRVPPSGYDLYAKTVGQARTIVRDLAPVIIVPNYVWDLYLAGCDPNVFCLGMCHSHSVDEYYLPLTWYESMISHFIAVSPECAEQLSEYLPLRVSDITTLPYGVHVPQQLIRDYDTNPLRLIYAGRLSQPQKRVGDFVRLVEHLLRARVAFVFDIIGDGEEFQPLQHAMAKWFPQAKVVFHGRLPHEEVTRLWPLHDVFVQTSDFEGTSVSMLEAMAYGVVPVVTAAKSGIAGVIEHGRNGFVTEIGDMETMACIIADIADSPSKLTEIGRFAHQSAHAFAMEQYCERFIRTLDGILVASRSTRQAKCAGGFGGFHPLLTQSQIIREQQEEIANLRTKTPKSNAIYGLLRKLRERTADRFGPSRQKPSASNCIASIDLPLQPADLPRQAA